MGYTTEFEGNFKFNRKLKKNEVLYLQKFNESRRMARNVDSKYGVEGEFYVEDVEEREKNVIDYNRPPRTQPGLWCQWRPTDDGRFLEWDGGEKFYYYTEWLQYIIKKFLIPAGIRLNGKVNWFGEERSDMGTIWVKNNVVEVKYGKILKKTQGVPKEVNKLVTRKPTDIFPKLLTN